MDSIGIALFFFLLLLGLFFAFVALVEYLWNITIPDVIGWNRVTYWQAFRLIILAMIFFGGLRVSTV